MQINQISKSIVDAVFHVHNNIGPGLFELVYEEVLSIELAKRGLSYTRQQPISLYYEGHLLMDHAFKADIIVENQVILELKSVEIVAPVHYKQLLTYLRLSGLKLGLLINFNEVLIKDGIHRMVNNL